MLSKKAMRLLALFTLTGFSGAGYLIYAATRETSFLEVLAGGLSWHYQLGTGLAYGTLTGFTALTLVSSELMRPVRQRYAEIIGRIRPGLGDIILVSVCAGIGEEMLFRAALQDLFGLWPTSILFVALHGYLNPFNWRLSVYGLALTVIIAGLGVLYVYVGIYTAMTAHAVIDIILLRALNTEAGEGNSPKAGAAG